MEMDVVNKNFINISNKLDGTSNGITATTNVNGSIHISGTTTGSGALFKGARVKIGKLKAGTYSFSAKLTGKSGTTVANSAFYFRPSYNDKPYAEMNPYANGSVYNNNVTLSSETEIWLEWYCNTSGISIDADLFLQIEQSTTKTDWVVNSSQTAIMPIQQEMLEGDYVADVEHHEWGKLVLTGNENFVQAQNANKLNYFYLGFNSVKLRGKTISNMLKSIENGIIWNKTSYDDIVSSASNSKTINVMLSDTTITTLQQFKEKLKELYNAGTPVVLYFELAEPIDLELTEEQKAVREQKMYTYKNITNISLSDELASIDVEYKKDLKTEHNKLQNEIDEIKQLIRTTETSALLLDNLQKDVEMEVE